MNYPTIKSMFVGVHFKASVQKGKISLDMKKREEEDKTKCLYI